jgi:MFS family permease
MAMSEAAPARRTSLGPAFWRIWSGQAVSTIGSATAGVGVAVYVFLETGNALWLGVLTACAGAPFVLLAPLLGRIDRFDRRAVMITGDSIAAVGTVAALTLAFLGRLDTWHLVLAAFIGGVGTAIQVPAAQAAVPALVDNDQLDRANGLAQLGPAMSLVIGPALATALVARWGIEAVLIVDAATFVVAVVATALTPFDSHVAQHTADGDVRDDAQRSVEGWDPVRSWLRGPGRGVLALVMLMATVNLCLGFFNVALVAMVASIDEARAGIPLTVGGLSMIAASAFVSRQGLPERRLRIIVFGVLTLAAGCAVAGLRPSLWVVALGMAIALAAVPVLSSASITLVHERVPTFMQGRMFALTGGISRALGPIGAVLAGIVIVAFAEPAMATGGALDDSAQVLLGTGDGRGAALVSVGVGVALTFVAALVHSTRSLRQLDETPNTKQTTHPDAVDAVDADAQARNSTRPTPTPNTS